VRNRGARIKREYYVQFKEHTRINKAVTDIKQQYGLTDKNITENAGLLAITGFSSKSAMRSLYSIAAVLFVLVLVAGVLMISGSINSNVAQRTKFFGMLRCIGASRQQIIHFVKLEAFNWCKTAVPFGVAIGVIVTWSICAVLRFGIGGEFDEMPLFKFSGVGVISGVTVGIVTVVLAARSPAKRAAKASPVAAVSSCTEGAKNERHAANTHFVKIETALGIHHAVSAKKNLILMTGSFALSIILFFVFCTGLDLVRALMPTLRPWQPDCSITGYKNSSTVDKGLVNKISRMSGVKRVFGNMYAGVSASSDKDIHHVKLVSYDSYMLSCAKDNIVSGDLSKVYGNSNDMLTIYNKNNPLKVGDKIKIRGEELKVAGALSDGLFPDDITVICSEKTFIRLMGEYDYAMLNMQLTSAATDADISAIKALSGKSNMFSDSRESNRQTNGTFWAFRILVYSFLAIIAMITVLYIINSTSMSVNAKIKQYGAMRAVGMSGRQLTKMIATEVLTYAFCGCAIGCLLGLPFSRFLYEKLITAHFGIAWSLPVTEIAIILFIVIAAAAAAIHTPSKRIRNMAVTETINEL
jgi:putative ABC transport system permease protein